MQIKKAVWVLILVQAMGLSAESLTVENAVTQALNQSPIIKKAEAAVEESQSKTDEVLHSDFYPKLSVNATHMFGHKYQIIDMPMNGETVSFPTIYPTTVYGVNAKIPLFAGFANKHRLEARAFGEKAAKKELSQSEFQLAEEVRLAYYQTLAAQNLQMVTEHHVTVLQEHLKQVQIQKKNGSARDYDVLRVQVQLSEAELDASEAKDNVDIARQTLTMLMGLKEDNRGLDGQLPVPDSKQIDGVTYDPTLKSRADLDALAMRQQALKKAEDAELSWYSPKVAAIGGFDYYNNLNANVSGDNFRNSYQTGIVLNWDILDGTGARARANATKAQRVQIESSLQQAKLSAYTEFERWKKKYVNNVQRYQIKQLDSQRSEESLRLAQLEVKAGTRTNADLLDAELDLFRAKAGTVIAQMNAAEALIKLEMNLGRRL